jgi:hypothetical protein
MNKGAVNNNGASNNNRAAEVQADDWKRKQTIELGKTGNWKREADK